MLKLVLEHCSYSVSLFTNKSDIYYQQNCFDEFCTFFLTSSLKKTDAWEVDFCIGSVVENLWAHYLIANPKAF